MKKVFLVSPLVALLAFAVWSQKGDDPVLEQMDQASLEGHFTFGRNLLDSLRQFRAHVENPEKFTAESCAGNIEILSREAMEIRPEMFQDTNLALDHVDLVQRSFDLRLSLAKRLREFSEAGKLKSSDELCVRSVRRALRFLRHFEDYVLVSALKPKEFNIKTDPVAGRVLQGKGPELLTPDGNKQIKLRSGDVLLSRGFAYTSAAIARIGEEEGQFSHAAQIYIDAPVGTQLSVAEAVKDRRVHVIEAHIEIGSFTRGLAGYVADGNTRVLQYRPRMDADLAHKAAQAIFGRVTSYQAIHRREAGREKYSVNDNLPYDFKMDSEDASAIFCSEIISTAFKSANIQLPTFPTRLKKNGLTRRMEIGVIRSFAPADLEIEPQFELLAEWRDLRKLPSVMRKDAVLSAMFKWMDVKRYDFQWDPADALKAQFAWSVRQMNLGFEQRLPKNMNRSIIAMTFVLERVGVRLEDVLLDLQAEKFKQGKMRPNFPEQMLALENFRAQDEKLYNDPDRSKRRPSPSIHFSFRATAAQN